MTQYNNATLKTFFQTGDVPQGSDYGNLIDSCLNLVQTAEQDMGGPLSTTKLITPKVSAGTFNVTGLLTLNNGSFTGTVSAATFTGNTANISGTVNAANGSFSAIVSAVTVNSNQYRTNTIIISAAGTAQSTAALISIATGINRLQGATDGTATGFILPSPTGNIGMEQIVINENAVSANLWPNTGCKINGLGANAVFAMAANTPYYVIYTAASAYAVK